MSDATNPNPPVETPPPPAPNPPPKVETPPPSTPAFNVDEFMTGLDTKMTAWTEKVVSGIKEAFPSTPPPPSTPPVVEAPPKETPPKETPPPPKETPPVPGKKSLYEWWFGGANAR